MATDNNQDVNDPSDDLAHDSLGAGAANEKTESTGETQADLDADLETELDRDPFEEIASEFSDRYRNGEMPSIDEYVRRHPELEAEIRDLFPTIAAMEQLKDRKAPSSPASGSLELEQLGDFRILGEIGRGGMGVVYEAEQVSLGRHVAVKVLPKQALLDERHLRRFEREAQTAAKLHHTNIVPVFGVGQQDGYHYIVMQFIPGVGLDEILIALRTMVLADDSAKYHMDSSSRASHASHNAKALLDGNFSKHVTKNSSFTKDAKRPSSAGVSVGGTAATMELPQSSPFKSTTGTIFSQQTGEQSSPSSGSDSDDGTAVPKSLNEDTSELLSSLDKEFYRSVARIGQQVSDALAYAHEQGTLHRDIKPGNLLLDETGTVWVADFGLAKLAEQDAVSRTGDLVGTLSYMPPESFAGETDARGDVYALGLTLFELLAMRPAYYGRDRGKLVKQITDGELPRLSKLNPSIPRDLETIVLKSVAHRPEDRYATAREMEEDLESFLNDLPIKARRMSLPEQFTRWCRKNKVVASLSAAVLTLLIVSSVTFGVLYQQAEKQREIVQIQRDIARDNKDKAEKSESEAKIATRNARDTAIDAIQALLVLFDGIAPNRLPPSADQALAANGSSDSSEDTVGDESNTEISDEETDTATVASVPVTPEMAANLELLLKSFAKLAKRADNDDFAPIFADLSIRVGKLNRLLRKHEEALEYFNDGISKYRKIVDDTDAPAASSIVGLASSYNEKGDLINLTVSPFIARQWFNKAHRLFEEHEEVLADSPRATYEEARTYFLQSMQYRSWGGRGPGRNGRSGGGSRGGRSEREFGRTGGRGGDRGERRDGGPEARGPGGPRDGTRRSRGEGAPPNETEFASTEERDRAQQLQKAIDLLKPLVETETNPEYRYLLARCYTVLATNGDRGGRPDPMGGIRTEFRDANIGEAVRLLSQLVDEQPHVPDYKYEYAMASLEMRGVDMAKRVQLTRETIQIASEISTSNPAVSDYAKLHLRALLEHTSALEQLANKSRRLPVGRGLALLEEAKKTLDQLRTTSDEFRKRAPAGSRIDRGLPDFFIKYLNTRLDERLDVMRKLETAEALRNDRREAEANELLSELRGNLLDQLKGEVRKPPGGSGPPGMDKLTELSIAVCMAQEQLKGPRSATELAGRLVEQRSKALERDGEISPGDQWATDLLNARIQRSLGRNAETKALLDKLRNELANDVFGIIDGDEKREGSFEILNLYIQVLRELNDQEGLRDLARKENEISRRFPYRRSRGGRGGGRPRGNGRSGNNGRPRGDEERDDRRAAARPE